MDNLKLDKIDQRKWFDNLVLFLAPVGVIYFTNVAVFLGIDGFSVQDFIPTNFMLGAMSLYIVNGLTDYLKKLQK